MRDDPTLPRRVRRLRDGTPGGGPVLYWMQQSQRATENAALEHALRRARDLGRGIVVVFGLDPHYPSANLRHFRFLAEGLADVRQELEARGVPFTVREGSPPDVALAAAEALDAALLVCDRGYLRHQVAWRDQVARAASVAVEEVEADVVVPVDVASDRQEHAARTLRPRIRRQLADWLVPLGATSPPGVRRGPALEGLDVRDPDALLAPLPLDRSVPPVPGMTGGSRAGRVRLQAFLDHGLRGYASRRARPDDPHVSRLSPYLHFGHLSPVEVARAALAREDADPEDVAAFLEQLVVRRELAVNFVRHAVDHDRFTGLPGWARATLQAHAGDRREHVYDLEEFEAAATHDPAWNACMTVMKRTGYLHNHLRMYWGKQVLAWSRSPEAAFQTLLHLNDRWFLDGRDPVSAANVGWIFGLHDQPFPERPVFGKIRPMTPSGLKRRFPVDAWVAAVRSG